MYDFIQSALTAATQIIAIAGFGGIALHAIYKEYVKTASIYAEVPHATPAPKPQIEVDSTLESPDIPPQPEAIASDIWQEEVTTSPAKYWVRQTQSVNPVLLLMPMKEVPTPKPTPKPFKKSAATAKLPKAHSKKLPQTPRPMSVGAAAIDYSQMNVEQLRKECKLQEINWRTGGDYGKSMKKAQMLAALR